MKGFIEFPDGSVEYFDSATVIWECESKPESPTTFTQSDYGEVVYTKINGNIYTGYHFWAWRMKETYEGGLKKISCGRVSGNPQAFPTTTQYV